MKREKKVQQGLYITKIKLKKVKETHVKDDRQKKKQLWFQLTERKVARHKSLCQMIKSPERKRKKRRRKA